LYNGNVFKRSLPSPHKRDVTLLHWPCPLSAAATLARVLEGLTCRIAVRLPIAATATSRLPSTTELSKKARNESQRKSNPSSELSTGRYDRRSRPIPFNDNTSVSSHCFCSVLRLWCTCDGICAVRAQAPHVFRPPRPNTVSPSPSLPL
jgi:hypothetical protein